MITEVIDKSGIPRSAIDTFSITTILATIAGWLPLVLAFVPAIYYAFLIWETKTVQTWRRRRRLHKALRRRLKALAAKAQRPAP